MKHEGILVNLCDFQGIESNETISDIRHRVQSLTYTTGKSRSSSACKVPKISHLGSSSTDAMPS